MNFLICNLKIIDIRSVFLNYLQGITLWVNYLGIIEKKEHNIFVPNCLTNGFKI